MKRQPRGTATVLCATDLTDASDEALRQATEAARARRAHLVVLHVLPDPVQTHPLLAVGRKSRHTHLPETHTRVGEAMRAQIARATGTASDVDVQIEYGTPYAAIIKQAETLHADLLVVGGSTSTIGREAERVVRYAHVPVLVARSSPAAGAVLATTDFSDASMPAIAAGVDWSRKGETPLVALHVVDLRPFMVQPDFGAIAIPLTAELEESLLGSARERLGKVCRRHRTKAKVLIETGDPAFVILEQALRLPAKLVVLGTAGATGLTRMVLGSVAETVVRRAPCSALVVRLNTTKARKRR